MSTTELQEQVLGIAEDAFILGAKSFRLNTINLIKSSLENPALDSIPAGMVLDVLAKILMTIDIDSLQDNMEDELRIRMNGEEE